MLYSDFLNIHKEIRLEVTEAGRNELFRQIKDNLLDITADELTIVIGLFIAKKETL
jgi:hypothetical protein